MTHIQTSAFPAYKNRVPYESHGKTSPVFILIYNHVLVHASRGGSGFHGTSEVGQLPSNGFEVRPSLAAHENCCFPMQLASWITLKRLTLSEMVTARCSKQQQ